MGEKSTADPNNIREMTDKDLGRVAEIWRDGAKEAHKEFIPTGFWDSIDIEKEIRDANECYVYDENGIIRGFITARKDGYIFELYVEEDFKRQGIGTALFETLKGKNPKFPELKGRYPQFTSHFYTHNYTSFRWHIKCGFKVFGVKFCPHTWLPKFEMIWKKEDNGVG